MYTVHHSVEYFVVVSLTTYRLLIDYLFTTAFFWNWYFSPENLLEVVLPYYYLSTVEIGRLPDDKRHNWSTW